MKKLIALLITSILSCTSINESPTIAKADELRIEYSKGACFGTCPIYTISLNTDRLVKYNGKRFVEPQGLFEWYMPIHDRKILSEIIERDELSQSSEYNMRAQDLPLTNLTIYLKTDTIHIKHKGGIPQNLKSSLKELEDLLMKNANWNQ
jgi:hypothetical protein